MLLLLISGIAGLINQGNRFFKEGKYDSALTFYNRAELLEPENPIVKINKGSALYKLGMFDDAEKAFLQALQAKNKKIKQRAFYNLGNTYFKKGDIKKAIESYINALKLNPQDKEAKKNLELCLKLPKNQNQNKNQQDKNNKQKKKQEKEKRKEEQKQEKKDLKQQLQAIQNEIKKELSKNMKKKRGKGGKVGRDW